MKEQIEEPSDFEGTIHIIGYTHADVAWVHTRKWHIDRYVRVVDEVLDMMDMCPDFKYYIDTWTELMIPYIRYRPWYLDRIRSHIRNGQLAVCAGHYGNVRSTNVGDETFVRNLQRGMSRWKEFEPSVRPKVYANMDVTIGHSQMPQLLSLAGLKGYFAMRPLEALDSEGVPRIFYWEGLSGDRILVCRACYGGLFMLSERHGPTWDSDWNAVVDGIWKNYLERPAHDGVNNIPLCVGSDDTRPDRFLLGNDEVCNYRELMNLWNARMPSKMKYSTPDELFESIEAETDNISTINRILDPTDVSYNIANHGRRGIWWHREKTDRLLVQSEILSTFAHIVGDLDYPENEFIENWEKLLDWTPHAVQYLFRQDWQTAEFSLMCAADLATKKIEKAVDSLIGVKLPMDSAGIVAINSLPYGRKEITPIWIINSDLSVDLGKIVDSNGHDVAFQVIDYPVSNAELSVLVEIEVPAGGYTSFRYIWDPVPPRSESEPDITNAETAPYWRTKYKMFDSKSIEQGTFWLSNNRIKITIENGYISKVEDLQTQTERTAPDGISFLEPVCYSVTKESWYLEAAADEPERFKVESVRWEQNGPLMWRIVRTGSVSGYWIRQYIELYKDEPAVRSSLQFMDPSANEGSLLAMSVPIADNSKISVDIPFGVENRDLDQVKYGFGERAIPGFFWGRTWANATDSVGQMTLLAEDGDKFFRAYGNPRKLVHFIAQKTKMFETSWEAYTDVYDVGGRQDFRHRLILLDKIAPSHDLIKIAEQVRHPIRYEYAGEDMMEKSRGILHIMPSSISLNAFYMKNGNPMIRITQMGDECADCEIYLPFNPSSAEKVDFNGAVKTSNIMVKKNMVRLTVNPWEIATIEIIR